MATKSKKELEKELKNGRATFQVWGTVGISDDTFDEPQTSKKSTFKYVSSNFPVKLGDGKQVYVQIMGGYDPAKPVLKKFSKKVGEDMLTIKWEHRNKQEIIEQIANNALIHIRLEKDENDKLIEKKFVSEIDAVEYLAEHLKDGDEVFVGGEIEYSRYNDKVQRRLNVRYISRNEGYINKDGDKIDAHKHESKILQTVLIDSNSFARKYKEELKKEGRTTINAFVPQYIGKEDGKEIKAVLPLPQNIILTANEKNLELRYKVIEKLLKPESRNAVREVVMKIDLNEGYDQQQGDIEITPELQELIDLGLADEESLKNEMTVRGNRVSELIFTGVKVDVDPDDSSKGIVRAVDKYDPIVLSVPDIEEEEEEDSDSENEEWGEDSEESESDLDADLAGLFG